MQGPNINSITLRFQDQDSEKNYRKLATEKSFRVQRVLSLAVIAFYVSMMWVFAPSHEYFNGTKSFFAWRIFGTLLMAYYFVTSRFPRSPRVGEWIGILNFGLLGILICGHLHAPDVIDPRHFGFAVVLLAVFYMYQGVSFTKKCVSGIAACICFVAAFAEVFSVNSFSLLAQLALVNVMGIAMGYMVERSARVSFWFESKATTEQAKAEKLLHNIMPREIAAKLQSVGDSLVERHDDVTVIFADLVGFSELARHSPPEKIVATLNQLYSRLDQLSEALGVEKIKTMGDAYMAAVGVPSACDRHAEKASLFALALLTTVQEFNRDFDTDLDFRVGIHTGPVVAGVIGASKFAYDIWGDTVNIASRMESGSEPGKIQVSKATANRLPKEFILQSRGTINVRSIGKAETYFLCQFIGTEKTKETDAPIKAVA